MPRVALLCRLPPITRALAPGSFPVSELSFRCHSIMLDELVVGAAVRRLRRKFAMDLTGGRPWSPCSGEPVPRTGAYTRRQLKSQAHHRAPRLNQRWSAQAAACGCCASVPTASADSRRGGRGRGHEALIALQVTPNSWHATTDRGLAPWSSIELVCDDAEVVRHEQAAPQPPLLANLKRSSPRLTEDGARSAVQRQLNASAKPRAGSAAARAGQPRSGGCAIATWMSSPARPELQCDARSEVVRSLTSIHLARPRNRSIRAASTGISKVVSRASRSDRRFLHAGCERDLAHNPPRLLSLAPGAAVPE